MNPDRLEKELRRKQESKLSEKAPRDVAAEGVEVGKFLFRQTTTINQANLASALITILNRSELTPEQMQRMKWVQDKVATWNAMDELAAETYQHEHAITPAALIKTYVAFQDRLEKLSSDPDNADLYAAMATKLKAEFTQNMAGFDFKGTQTRLSRHQSQVGSLIP